MNELSQKKCIPCEVGGVPLGPDEIKRNRGMLASVWEVSNDGKLLSQRFAFKDFKEAMAFVDALALLAEEENHHPDISISYRRVLITLSTHAVGGLSENDFILARKIELLPNVLRSVAAAR